MRVIVSSTGNSLPSARIAVISMRRSSSVGLAGLEVAGEAAAVPLAQRRRHDQLGHLAADRVGGAVAEGALGGRVELDHAAVGVHGDRRSRARSRASRAGPRTRRGPPARRGGAGRTGRSARPGWPSSRSAARRPRAPASRRTRSRPARRRSRRIGNPNAARRPASRGRGPAREVRVRRDVARSRPGSPVAHTRPGQALAAARTWWRGCGGRSRRRWTSADCHVVTQVSRSGSSGVSSHSDPASQPSVLPIAASARDIASSGSSVSASVRATACSVRMNDRVLRMSAGMEWAFGYECGASLTARRAGKPAAGRSAGTGRPRPRAACA